MLDFIKLWVFRIVGTFVAVVTVLWGFTHKENVQTVWGWIWTAGEGLSNLLTALTS